MTKQLVLTKSMIINSPISLYIRLRFYRAFTTYQSCHINKDDEVKSVITYFDAEKYSKMTQMQLGEVCGVNRVTWAKHGKPLAAAKSFKCTTLEENFTLMPFTVFDAFLEWLDGVAATYHAKEALLRFYCYMYFHAAFYQGQFQNSQTNIAIELGTTAKLVGQRLKLLRENGWLRRFGTYKFGGEMNWCYKYAIPEEHQAKDIF